jgi:hypothetical protein
MSGREFINFSERNLATSSENDSIDDKHIYNFLVILLLFGIGKREIISKSSFVNFPSNLLARLGKREKMISRQRGSCSLSKNLVKLNKIC